MGLVLDYRFDEAAGSATAADTGGPTAEDGTFMGDATTDGLGSATFDGTGDYVEAAASSAFDLSEGTILIEATQAVTAPGDRSWDFPGPHTLFSVDATGFGAGGHLSIYITSTGLLEVRHQTLDTSYVYSGGSISPGQAFTVQYSFGPTGSVLSVNGTVVDTGTVPLTLGGAAEPLTIGASQAASGLGTADNLTGFFEGEISRVRIDDDAVGAGPVACFTAGTLIDTPWGRQPVESLTPGDLVLTRDQGSCPVRAIVERRISVAALRLFPRLRPVVIARGALGCDRELRVSRQHCMEFRVGGRPVLIRAAHLARFGDGRFRVAEGCRKVRYVHLLLDRHEIVFANGAPSETLLPGASLTRDLLPDIATRALAAPCRPILSGADARAALREGRAVAPAQAALLTG